MMIEPSANSQALQAFLSDRAVSKCNRNGWLYIHKGHLEYNKKVSPLSLFLAKLGFGNVSMYRIAKFIHENQESCFHPNNKIVKIEAFNTFIQTYNCSHYRQVKWIRDLIGEGDIHQLNKSRLKKCQLVLEALMAEDSETRFAELVESCQLLAKSLATWKNTFDKPSKEEKKTLNDLLVFKNQVRAVFFAHKGKTLKGAHISAMHLTSIGDEAKEKLRAALKEIRLHVLTNYFRERLLYDAERLAALRKRFDEHKAELSQPDFLENQLNYWQTRLAHGKPIALPKWYHCTQEVETLGKILTSSILYAMKDEGNAGSFVSNNPEIEFFGDLLFDAHRLYRKDWNQKSRKQNCCLSGDILFQSSS